MKNFTGKVAVITGGGSGIGKALAMAAAKRGMKLALLDIQSDALAQSVDELHQMGAVALGITADVSDAEAMQTVVEQIEAHYGAIHVVFNNAGVTSSGPVWESTEKDWDWLLGIVGGLIGGNVAGAKNSLGSAGNSVAGALGGALGGGLLGNALGGSGDIAQIAGSLGGGGVAGAVITAVVGMLMKGRGAK